MDGRVRRILNRFDIEEKTVVKLVEAGFDLSHKIKFASDSDLKKVEGIGDATVAKIREAMKK